MITRRKALSAVALFSVLRHNKLVGQETAAKAPSTQEPLNQHRQCTFVGEIVPLDGSSFEECTFQNCMFAYAGGPSRLIRNKFINCSFELVGGAANGLFLLRTLGLITTSSAKVKTTPSQIAIEQPPENIAPTG
jgi:hypothetical protein